MDAIQDLGEDDYGEKGEEIVSSNVETQEGFQPKYQTSPLTSIMDGTGNILPIMNDIYPMLPFEDTPVLYHYDPTDVDKPTVGRTVYRLLSVPPVTKSSPADDLLSYLTYRELTGYDKYDGY